MLDEDEIVIANDYEMNVGYAFDLKTAFSGIEIPDNKKMSQPILTTPSGSADQSFVLIIL